jgi:peptidoglycan hydrolase CwlO-like protein
MPDTVPTVIITALIASIPGIVTILVGRRKQTADATKIIQEAAAGLVKDFQARIEELEAELAVLRPLRKDVQDLQYQVKCQELEINRLQQELITAQARIRVLETENEQLRAGK